MAVTPIALLVLALATVATSFVSGILGMAGGMMLMGVLLALLPLPAAMMLHGITQLAANGWRALLLRREISWGSLAAMRPGRSARWRCSLCCASSWTSPSS